MCTLQNDIHNYNYESNVYQSLTSEASRCGMKSGLTIYSFNVIATTIFGKRKFQ